MNKIHVPFQVPLFFLPLLNTVLLYPASLKLYLEVGLNFKERTMRYFESLGTKNFIEIKRCLAKEFQKYLRFITYLEVKMTFS